MTTAVESPPLSARTPAEVPTIRVWRLTVDEYHAMIQSGILKEGEPIELLEGLLVPKMSKNPPHRIATRTIFDLLYPIRPAGWYIDAQEPITTTDSEPEPDLAIIRGKTKDYRDRHPGLGDISLVIEVSDTSLEQDRGPKKRLYARAGIPTYWIVNLIDGQIEVYTQPGLVGGEPDYCLRKDYVGSDSVPVLVDGTSIGELLVQDVLP